MFDADFLRGSGPDADCRRGRSRDRRDDTMFSWSPRRWTCPARSRRISAAARHFPFISPSHIVFCGDKGIVAADHLIDYCARHLQTFNGRPPCFPRRTISAEQRFQRLESWNECTRFFRAISKRSAHPRPADPLASHNVVTTALSPPASPSGSLTESSLTTFPCATSVAA